MDFKKLGKKLIGKGLPLVGRAILGPAGGSVGEMITGVLGLNGDASEDEILKEIERDPESLLKLKELEINKEIELKRLAIKEDEMYLVDTQDARQSQIDRQEQTGKPDYNLYVLAWTIVFGYFGVIVVLMLAKVPDNVNDVLFMLLGTLATCFGGVVQYFFGSSKSSSEKTKLLVK